MASLNLTTFLLVYPIPALVACYILHSLVTFTIHLQQARASGLPYMIMPYSERNLLNVMGFSINAILWRLTHRYFPAWLADKVIFNVLPRRWSVRDRMFRKLGRVFLIVSPGSLVCHIADAGVATHVYRSRQQFAKATEVYRLLEIYGTSNILTSTDNHWAHHRHHTGAAFNEKNNALVWRETMKQVTGMQNSWMLNQKKDPSSRPACFEVPASREDILKLALQIISSAGFGVSLPYIQTTGPSKRGPKSLYEDGPAPPPGYSFTFRSVTEYMQTNFRTTVLAVQLVPSWIPQSVKDLFVKTELAAYEDMGKYLRNLISMAEESDANEKGSDGDNLATLMIGSSAQTSTSKFRELTSQEVLGNLHIFVVAGHETTATTLRFALFFLAMYPEKQEWVRRGIRDALEGQSEDPHKWDYDEVFPKLVTPLCVMLETLRLCPAVITIPKSAAYGPVQLEYEGEMHHLPSGTNMNINAGGLHYNPEYWGRDAASFDPARWDASNKDSYLARNDGTSGLSAPGLEYPTIHRPVRGAFVGFSDGLRSCVGKKFAQVEFVAVLAVLLRNYEVSLAPKWPGESIEKTRERAWEIYEGSFTMLTLSMTEDVPLKFSRNES